MGTLHHHPFFIRYQGGSGDHVVQIRAGRTIRSGVGQSPSGCARPLRAGGRMPAADRARGFRECRRPPRISRTSTRRLPSPTALRTQKPPPRSYDFGLYPREAGADAQGLWQIDETVTRIAFSALASAIGEMPLSDAISGSLEKVGHVLAQDLRG